ADSQAEESPVAVMEPPAVSPEATDGDGPADESSAI
ncbi:MAG: hypothetical protein RLZZ93_1147, partial [Actinomycetota bacterium]